MKVKTTTKGRVTDGLYIQRLTCCCGVGRHWPVHRDQAELQAWT